EPVAEGEGREIAGTAVDADSERPRGRRVTAGEAAEKHERQVVDRLIAEVLENLEGRRAAGAGEAGDHEKAAPTGVGRIAVPRGGAGGRRRLVVVHGGGIIDRGPARTASRTLAAAEASAADSRSSGTATPSNSTVIGSGNRSCASGGTRSMTRTSGA